MPDTLKQFGVRIITGQDRSALASVARLALRLIEPFYTVAMTLRNACYNHGIFKIRDLGRPTISVGNITTGGTGKTPVVKWLADELRRRGHRPVILLRGYASGPATGSDEAHLLDQSLNAGHAEKIPVRANPSRVHGAADALADQPGVTHFILDDGFQHRRARRDFNLVLINSTQPFGFGHVLPRGLLREPLTGLERADAFLITRCSLATVEGLCEIESFLAGCYPSAPIFHCDHVHSELLNPSTGQSTPMETLAGQKVFLTAGIGDPAAFDRQITGLGCQIAGVKWFPDHHAFTAADVTCAVDAATLAGADLVVTTEKDWVKIRSVMLPGNSAVPIAVARLEIRFHANDAQRMLAYVLPQGIS